MPKSITIADAILLLCLSALAGSGSPVLLGRGHPFEADADIVWVVAHIALATGFVMLATEFFSGHAFIALIASAGVTVGWTSMYRSGVDSVVAEQGWIVGLLAVVLWFALMASAARADR
jgi:hypothetical protein